MATVTYTLLARYRNRKCRQRFYVDLTCRNTCVSEEGFPPPSFDIRNSVSMIRIMKGSRKQSLRCHGEDAVMACDDKKKK